MSLLLLVGVVAVMVVVAAMELLAVVEVLLAGAAGVFPASVPDPESSSRLP